MAKKKTAKKTTKKTVTTLTHDDAKRRNIPTAEYQSVMAKEQARPVELKYPRNTDLDPQLVWRGKDEQDWSDLVVHAPPLYIQEKVHPKVLIDDLRRESDARAVAKELIERAKSGQSIRQQLSLFDDFNGVPEGDAKTEFYQHDANWTNRMILGDSLQVMASLAEREGLRGRVQCIYFDPPYGIKFNSNFQWSTTSRDVKDGNRDHITREPEQVKAFRDTWRDGIHSYLTYLRDRLTVARDLLHETGSIFVQIGDENVHRVRAVMDEVFGEDCFVSAISFLTTGGFETGTLANIADHILWFSKQPKRAKYRQLWESFSDERQESAYRWIKDSAGATRSLKSGESLRTLESEDDVRPFKPDNIISQGGASEDQTYTVFGRSFRPPANSHWKATFPDGMTRLHHANRIYAAKNSLRYIREISDFPVKSRTNVWDDTATGQFTDPKVYVVQTNTKIVERCVLMATDPGDLVLDPTCGSGTTAYVAEQWGRRWITIDTSRVSLALARARIMGARYPFYLLADSKEGQAKEAEVTRTEPSTAATHGNIRQGFVYERVPHITLKSIANNAEIDVIWEKYLERLSAISSQLSALLKLPKPWEEWEVPRETDDSWPKEAKKLHAEWWKLRIARQKEIDASIAAKADFEYLYDKPYPDKSKVRVAGPFTVESLSPHRTLTVDENDDLVDPLAKSDEGRGKSEADGFAEMILENLRTAGVQQAHKEDRITFTSLVPWPGDLVCAEGTYMEGPSPQPSPSKGKGAMVERRAAIFIGPEFGTVQRQDLVQAAREAGDADFDVLIACAFNFEAHATEFNKLGRIPVLKARINADLHMADDLKNTGKGNLFVIFGEPDIDLLTEQDGKLRVKINGVDVFKPQEGKVESNNTDKIACWFVDTNYNDESFFVRHAYFLGASDPYKSLKTTLKAEIDADAWESLYSDTSRPFEKPESGRIAVKVINHLGDEVMKVFGV